jgi:hypothetical protein
MVDHESLQPFRCDFFAWKAQRVDTMRLASNGDRLGVAKQLSEE